jgi:hypothetical protein
VLGESPQPDVVVDLAESSLVVVSRSIVFVSRIND